MPTEISVSYIKIGFLSPIVKYMIVNEATIPVEDI